MTKALQDAKVDAKEIDYVNAHAPSTSIGDASEMKALKAVFLPRKRSKSRVLKRLPDMDFLFPASWKLHFAALPLRMGSSPVLLMSRTRPRA